MKVKLALTILMFSSLAVTAARPSSGIDGSRFDVRLISLGYADLDQNKSLDQQAEVVNVVMSNSFSIDLKKGIVKVEATDFEKIIHGQTYGSQFTIQPQEVSLPLNCCYNTVFVHEITPDNAEYKTVYGRREKNQKDKDPWEVVFPRTRIK